MDPFAIIKPSRSPASVKEDFRFISRTLTLLKSRFGTLRESEYFQGRKQIH